MSDFNDLREDATKQYEQSQAEYKPAAGTYSASPRASSRKMFGMTSLQRFIILVMLLLSTCMIGGLCLFATGKIAF